MRLSGSGARAIAERILKFSGPPQWRSWGAALAKLADIDRVVVTFFEGPRSYTAEDVIEISCHGSPVVLGFCVQRAVEAGARLAEPGEFTLRAYLNGRIDLPRAEAVRDLIEATTLYQARVAAQQVEGSVSRRIAPAEGSAAGTDLAARSRNRFRRRRHQRGARPGDPAPPGARSAGGRPPGRQLRLRQAGAFRPDAGDRRPAERGQEQPVQPAAGAGPRHCHRHPRHHARPCVGGGGHPRNPGEAGGYGGDSPGRRA